MIEPAVSMTRRRDRTPEKVQKRHSSTGARSFLGLARPERKGAVQRFHLCVGSDIEKTASQPKILEERPKVLIPRIAVEGETPEVMKQNRCRDHVEYEQYGCLTPIKAKQDTNRTHNLEGAAEHQQERRGCRDERYPPVGGLRHGRLIVEYLAQATERE